MGLKFTDAALPIQITGMVKKPQTINIDDLIHYRSLESRIYRHRCGEAWSMVIPWDGHSLSEFIVFASRCPAPSMCSLSPTSTSSR